MDHIPPLKDLTDVVGAIITCSIQLGSMNIRIELDWINNELRIYDDGYIIDYHYFIKLSKMKDLNEFEIQILLRKKALEKISYHGRILIENRIESTRFIESINLYKGQYLSKSKTRYISKKGNYLNKYNTKIVILDLGILVQHMGNKSDIFQDIGDVINYFKKYYPNVIFLLYSSKYVRRFRSIMPKHSTDEMIMRYIDVKNV